MGGPTGPDGLGATGPTGAGGPGPTGPAGTPVTGSIYTSGGSAPVLDTAIIPVPNQQSAATGLTFDGNGTVTFTQAGLYLIAFGILFGAATDFSVALFINGATAFPYSITNNRNGTFIGLRTMGVGDTLALQNVTGGSITPTQVWLTISRQS